MSSTTIVTIFTASGGVIAALIAFLGVRVTQRSAAKAQRVTAAIERDKVDASAYAEARLIWDAIIKDLREKSTDQSHEISNLRLEFAAQHAETSQLRRRLADLEQKRAGDRQAIHVLTVYIRQLLRLIENNNLTPPPAPDGLDLQA